MLTVRPLQLAVMSILDHATAFKWSLQGMGLLRLYVRDIGRIHIWDETLRFPHVSMIHNHSWDLKSTIVGGVLTNRKYVPVDMPFDVPANANRANHCAKYHTKLFITGYEGRPVDEQKDVWLTPLSPETFVPGTFYIQSAHEIHETDAVDGTVTILERQDDAEGHANIYWPAGTEWGTAVPRPATDAEIIQGVKKALEFLA